MEKRIKSIIKSNDWNDHTVEPFKAETFSQKVSADNRMWKILENGGSLFIKKMQGEIRSGTVTMIDGNPDKIKPEMIPYNYTMIVGVGNSIFNDVFSVFINRIMFEEGSDFELVYSSANLQYVHENIEKILREVVKPDFYYDRITTVRTDNRGVVASHTIIKYPTIESDNENN